MNWKFSPGLVLLLISLSACTDQIPAEEIPPVPTIAVTTPDQPKLSPSGGDHSFGLTYQQQDGNRLVEGRGKILDADPISIQLGGEILWLVGLPFEEGSLWTAVLDDGIVVSFTVKDGQVNPYDIGRELLTAGTPPMILDDGGEIYLNIPPSPEASNQTHPLSPNPETGRVVFITGDGDLVLWEQGKEIGRLEVNALPDARLIQDERGRLLFLSDPTDRYDHGVLGDNLEAASITLVETNPVLKFVSRIEIPAPKVIESINPIWADLNDDGEKEILVTVSDAGSGARLVLYDETGLVLAQGPAAGQGYRWRHQLAAAPLGPQGQMLIVDVLRPHLDATLEFFSWDGNELKLEGELPGFSSHRIGARNLDMALVGDLNGDGIPEVIVPGLGQETLNGIGYVDSRAELLWTFQLAGRLTSNLAGVKRADGSLVLGAGVGNRLMIWE